MAFRKSFVFKELREFLPAGMGVGELWKYTSDNVCIARNSNATYCPILLDIVKIGSIIIAVFPIEQDK
jgi:hypothetical protein